MKYLFALLCSLSTITLFATVHTVDNSAKSVADFTNLQTAIDAASEGDTLLIKGSYVRYIPLGFSGSLDDRTIGIKLDKQLVLIGEGASGHPNGPDFDQRMDKTAIHRMFFTTGEGTSASGSTLVGLKILDAVFGSENDTDEVIQDLEFREIRLRGSRHAEEGDTVDGLTIIRSSISFGSSISWAGMKNIELFNNILRISGDLIASSGDNVMVNNIMMVSPGGELVKYAEDNDGNDLFEEEWSIENFKLHNTIFLKTVNSGNREQRLVFKTSNSEIKNCIVMGPFDTRDLLTEDNVGLVLSNLSVERKPFVLIPPYEDSGSSSDGIRSRTAWGNYHLVEESVGKNNGIDGTDIGIYGGEFPWIDGPVWRYSNQPSLPVVESLELEKNTVKPGEGLKVRVRARAKGNQ